MGFTHCGQNGIVNLEHVAKNGDDEIDDMNAFDNILNTKNIRHVDLTSSGAP